MKVIKKPDTAWSYKHTCANCTAELEVEKSDVRYYHYDGDQREPGYETWSATCPICSTNFDIPANTLPKAVQVEIKKGLSTRGGPFDR
jgi:hypothetical protein